MSFLWPYLRVSLASIGNIWWVLTQIFDIYQFWPLFLPLTVMKAIFSLYQVSLSKTVCLLEPRHSCRTHWASRTIQPSHKILYVTIGGVWHNHHNLAITFPRVQLVPDRVRLNMVSKQHGSVDEDLETTSAHQTSVCQTAMSLELFQVLKHWKFRNQSYEWYYNNIILNFSENHIYIVYNCLYNQ